MDINKYYAILEVQPNASLEEVKQSYKELAQVWHPDRYSHNVRLQQKAQAKFKEINEAHEQLVKFYETNTTHQAKAQSAQVKNPRTSDEEFIVELDNHVKNSNNSTSDPSSEALLWMGLLFFGMLFILAIKFPILIVVAISLGVQFFNQAGNKK